ncbi:MAG TPA: ice-binding family protein [Candidatus Eisenbacteria bacterium]|nr:ice-binding family protein [Candidatus Eisenbacteria bacterium]
MNIRRSIVAAVPIALLMVGLAGCSKDSSNPVSPGGDTTAPIVTSTNPPNGATGVAVITASFNEAMDPTRFTATTFTLTGPGATPVAGTVSYDVAAKVAKFAPTSPLALGTIYTATVTTGVEDTAGNALAVNHAWTFTTSATASAQLAPALGGAGAFVVLAGSTVTNTGATALSGDLGVSPGTATTGFPPGVLTGTIHTGDATSATAMADLTIAYDDAAGRTLGPVTVAGNLGGLTLPPGLYKSTSSLAISSGDLTLDAQGDANAIFIFQMASTMTTTSGRAVILTGGAKASHVFWQVGSSATIGTTSIFKGTIMADQAITLGTGATLEGRALARIGAVTLAGNSVVMPTP